MPRHRFWTNICARCESKSTGVFKVQKYVDHYPCPHPCRFRFQVRSHLQVGAVQFNHNPSPTIKKILHPILLPTSSIHQPPSYATCPTQQHVRHIFRGREKDSAGSRRDASPRIHPRDYRFCATIRGSLSTSLRTVSWNSCKIRPRFGESQIPRH